MKLITLENKQQAKDIVKKYQYLSRIKVIEELDKISRDVSEKDIQKDVTYGISDIGVIKANEKRVFFFTQGEFTGIDNGKAFFWVNTAWGPKHFGFDTNNLFLMEGGF
jgi:uncharacterized protein YdaL